MTPSLARRLLPLASLAWMAAILAVSVLPGSSLPDLTGRDLAAHAFTYAALAALLLAWLVVVRGLPRLGAGALAAAISALYGAALEGVQAFVPGRHASLDDVVANAVGGLAGAALAALALRARAAPAGS